MGLSVRVFLLNKSGEPQKFSYARFQRLLKRDPGESLREHAGLHARFVIAYIQTIDGDFLQVAHVEYPRLKIAADGRVDQETEQRGLSLAAGSIDLPPLDSESRKLIPAQHIFSSRQYLHEFCWSPSAAEEQCFLRLINDQWRKRLPRA